MNKSELIEIFAAVSIRVWGFIMCISSFVYFLHWESALESANLHHISLSTVGKQDAALAILHLIIALFFFAKTVPLSRLLCRGLDQLLQKSGPPAT